MTLAESAAGSAPRRLLGAIAREVRWVLAGYAQVLFTTRPLVGLLAAAATFVSPEHGLAGLLGLASANLAAWALDLDAQQRHDGFFAFNGLLCGLALGLYYRLNGPFLIAILVGGVLVAVVAAGLRSLFLRWLGIPVLSLPFLVVAWLLYGAAARLPGLEVTLEPVQVAAPLGQYLPVWLDTFLRSAGAVFFQLSAPSGALVVLALLVWSRLGLLIGVIGYVAGHGVYLALGGHSVDLTGELLGFNFIMAAIAVAAVWTIPKWPAFGLAAITGTVAALTAAAGAAVLPRMGLPVLAAPLIATTHIVLLALAGRLGPRRLLQPLVPGPSPEATLRDETTRRERFVPVDRAGLPLPVGGRWRVTQSFDGPHTHRGAWRHGLDFEAIDQDGRVCRGEGRLPEDYYAFGVPVFAPLGGRVVNIVAHLDDTPIGEVDADHPWGNTLVLWHGGTLYSAYSHLAKDSVAVGLGAEVGAGAFLARVGCSGRAPTPHLHMQAQASAVVGAPTIAWTLLHWLHFPAGAAQPSYRTHAVPAADAVLESLIVDGRLAAALGFPLGQRLRFAVGSTERIRTETWTPELDFSSRLWLTSNPSGARLRLYRSPFMLLAEAYEGPRDTALYRFYKGLPRLPLADRPGLTFCDTLEPDREIGPLRRLVCDLGAPFGRLVRLDTASTLGRDEAGRPLVRTEARLLGPLAGRGRKTEVTLIVDRLVGLERIEERVAGRPLWMATRTGTEPVVSEEQDP